MRIVCCWASCYSAVIELSWRDVAECKRSVGASPLYVLASKRFLADSNSSSVRMPWERREGSFSSWAAWALEGTTAAGRAVVVGGLRVGGFDAKGCPAAAFLSGR